MDSEVENWREREGELPRGPGWSFERHSNAEDVKKSEKMEGVNLTDILRVCPRIPLSQCVMGIHKLKMYLHYTCDEGIRGQAFKWKMTNNITIIL